MSDGTLTGPLAEAFENAYERLTAAQSLTPDAIGLMFSEFEIANNDVIRLVRARGKMAVARLLDEDAHRQAQEANIEWEEFAETILLWLAVEMLLTGLLAGLPSGRGA